MVLNTLIILVEPTIHPTIATMADPALDQF